MGVPVAVREPPDPGALLRPDQARIATNGPHDLRHRAATKALRKSHNIRAVQELLSHASVATTEVYTDVDSADVRDCVAPLRAS